MLSVSDYALQRWTSSLNSVLESLQISLCADVPLRIYSLTHSLTHSLTISLKLMPTMPYPNTSSCISEGLLCAKLSMMVELSNDRSRSFSDDIISKEEREIHQQEKFADGSLLFWLYWALALLDTGRQQKMGVKHCQIQKARQLKQNVRLSHCFTKMFSCESTGNVLTIFIIDTVIIARWFFILMIVTFFHWSFFFFV